MARDERTQPPTQRRNGQGDPEGKPRFRYELRFGRAILFGAIFAAGLVWMFIFGVLVGRGLPLEKPLDPSTLAAKVAQFLSLGKPAPEPSRDAAKTWEPPEKILSGLRYHETLAQNLPSAYPPPPPPPEETKEAAKPPAAPDPKKKAAPPAPPQPSAAQVKPPAAPTPPPSPPPPPPAASGAGGRYTVMVASMKSAENARHLADQLKARGYDAPRVQVIDRGDKGVWHRVVVGSFRSREEAQRFVADFNRREGREGLLIREE